MKILVVVVLICVVVMTTTYAARRPKNGRCPPGTHVRVTRRGRTVCRACPRGSYMDTPSKFRVCKRHRACKSSEDELMPGTATSDVVCRCRKGGRHYYNVDDTYGYDCLDCRNGQLVQIVLNGRDYGDTVCCPLAALAFRTPTGEARCHNLLELRFSSKQRKRTIEG